MKSRYSFNNFTSIARTLLVLGLIYATPGLGISEEAPFEELLERWNNTLDAAEVVVSQSNRDIHLLNPVLESLRVVKESAKLNREEATLKLNNQKKLLFSLGEPPNETAPPESAEVVKKRESIGKQITAFDGIVKQSNLVIVRANTSLDQVSDITQQHLTQALYSRTKFPLTPGIIGQAIIQIPEQAERLQLGFSNWYENALNGRFKFFGLVTLPIVFAIWVLSSIFISRAIRRRYGWSMKTIDPSPNQKFLATLSECVGQILIPIILITVFSWVLFSIIGVSPTREMIISSVVFGIMNFVLVIGLAKIALIPKFPQYRISHFTDSSAKTLYRSLYIAAATGLIIEVIMVLFIGGAPHTLEIPQIGAIEAPAEVTSLVAVISLVVMTVLIFNILKDQNWRFVDQNADSPQEVLLSPTYRFVFIIARILLVGGIVMALAGYLNFGLFILMRAAWILSAIALIRLIHGFVSTLLTEVTSRENRFGSYVCDFMKLSTLASERIVFWITVIIDISLLILLIPLTLVLIGVPWDDIQPAIISLTTEIHIGSRTLSLIDISGVIASFIALFVGIRLFQAFVSNRLLVQTNLDIGVRNAIGSGIGYVGIGVLLFFTLSMLGLETKELALIFGALSVGIGFGLQHVINNFISGLVLLIQRPIKSGDWIVVGENQGYVKQVNVITTEIQTFDNAALIVPNGDLVSSQVINWMHKSKLGRVVVPIGVSYDSDPMQIQKILLDIANDIPDVLPYPAPNVIFKDFGENALMFEIRFFIRDMDNYWRAASAARFRIKSEFDQAGIEIPFPQRVVKLNNDAANKSISATE